MSLPTTLVMCVLAWPLCPVAGMLPAAALIQACAAAGVAAYAACSMAEKAVMNRAACMDIVFWAGATESV